MNKKSLFLFLVSFILVFIPRHTYAVNKQLVPDRQIATFTNTYVQTTPILIGTTLQQNFSNLEAQICILISNKVGSIGSNLFLSVTNDFYLNSNPSNFLEAVDVTNTFYPRTNPSNFITAAEVAAQSFNAGYVHGLVPTFSNGNNITVTPGSIVTESTNFFRSATAVGVDVTTLLGTISARDIIYFYVDASDSSTTNVDAYGSFDTPVAATGDGHDTHPTTTEDIHIGSARANDAGSALLDFHTTGEDSIYRYTLKGLSNNASSTASAEVVYFDLSSQVFTNWTAGNQAGAAVNDLVPAAVSSAHIMMHSEDSGAFSLTTLRTLGSVASGAVAGGDYREGAIAFLNENGHDHNTFQVWVPLLRATGTRNIFVGSDGNDPDGAWATIFEWEIKR